MRSINMRMNNEPPQHMHNQQRPKDELNKILFICSWADKHIGLFDDLRNDNRVVLKCYRYKNHNRLLRIIKRNL